MVILAPWNRSSSSVVAEIELVAVAGKPTRECFIGPLWTYRSSDIDSKLPVYQPEATACVIKTIATSRDRFLKDVLAVILGVEKVTDTRLLAPPLIERGHTITLPQAEKLADETKCYKKVVMPTGKLVSKHKTLFFVETGDPRSPIAIGTIMPGAYGQEVPNLSVYMDWFDFDFPWVAGHHLFVRNLDTSKL